MTSTRIVPAVVLLAVLALLQGQLWLGRGSLPRVQEMQRVICVPTSGPSSISSTARFGSLNLEKSTP